MIIGCVCLKEADSTTFMSFGLGLGSREEGVSGGGGKLSE